MLKVYLDSFTQETRPRISSGLQKPEEGIQKPEDRIGIDLSDACSQVRAATC